MSHSIQETLSFTADEDDAGIRLDVYLAGCIEDASRSFLKSIIKDDRVRVDAQTVTRPSRTMHANDSVEEEQVVSHTRNGFNQGPGLSPARNPIDPCAFICCLWPHASCVGCMVEDTLPRPRDDLRR